MEAPPLPEETEFDTSELGVVFAYTADQLQERDAYWLAKVEEARRDAKQNCIAKAYQIAAHTGMRKHHEMAECLATSIREGG